MTLLNKSMMMLLLITCPAASVFSMKRPNHVVDAREEFKDNTEKLDASIEYIIKYYEEVGEEGLTAFEQEIDDICREAHDYFASQDITEKSAVIVDIDETVLSNYFFSKECNFGSKRGDAMQFRKEMKCVAIKPSQAFCGELKYLGYKLIYISSRRATLTEETRTNLEREGFHVDELYLMPMELYNQKASSGPWKESVRKELSEKYDIIACMGDSPSDFEGEYTGEKTILFPNYLYKA